MKQKHNWFHLLFLVFLSATIFGFGLKFNNIFLIIYAPTMFICMFIDYYFERIEDMLIEIEKRK